MKYNTDIDSSRIDIEDILTAIVFQYCATDVRRRLREIEIEKYKLDIDGDSFDLMRLEVDKSISAPHEGASVLVVAEELELMNHVSKIIEICEQKGISSTTGELSDLIQSESYRGRPKFNNYDHKYNGIRVQINDVVQEYISNMEFIPAYEVKHIDDLSKRETYVNANGYTKYEYTIYPKSAKTSETSDITPEIYMEIFNKGFNNLELVTNTMRNEGQIAMYIIHGFKFSTVKYGNTTIDSDFNNFNVSDEDIVKMIQEVIN